MNVKGSLGTERVDKLLVKRLSNNAKVPVRGTSGAIGYDLTLAE